MCLVVDFTLMQSYIAMNFHCSIAFDVSFNSDSMCLLCMFWFLSSFPFHSCCCLPVLFWAFTCWIFLIFFLWLIPMFLAWRYLGKFLYFNIHLSLSYAPVCVLPWNTFCVYYRKTMFSCFVEWRALYVVNKLSSISSSFRAPVPLLTFY